MSKRKSIPGQLAFDFDAPTAVVTDLAANVQHLIDVGLLTRFGLDTVNGGTVHNKWGGSPSASRIHRFPFHASSRTGLLHVVHPALETMPYAATVSRIVGYPVVYHEDVEKYWGDRGWHHAVDLCTKSSWEELLATRHLTTVDRICGAIAFKLDSKFDGKDAIDVKIARTMLETLSVPEPDDRSAGLIVRQRHDLSSPFCRTEDRCADAWMRVHAIEDGIVRRGKSGHLELVEERIAA